MRYDLQVLVDLSVLVSHARTNPARAIGLEAKGQLAVNVDADFVVLSPELDVLRTFSRGDKILSEKR